MSINRKNYYRDGARRPSGNPAYRTQDRDREIAHNRPAGDGLEWKRMDLHIHTPASTDYRDPGISYLDILKKAEEKGLDIIAFADHNSVGGYASMHREIETLSLLERLGRLTDEERTTLEEYRRLLAKLVVLPAFEFTATFGFHILGVFPEETSVRKLEHLLLDLNVPEEKMVMGAPDAGSTSDVLRAYQAITAAGGLAIAAHANSSNGVAMQGFPFGGQTKIAYTQDPNLAALEVTDLESPGRRNTASFYNASKPEYPRRMHCIQGSDAHSVNTEQADSMNKRLGVGARITEVLVREASFAGLKEVLLGTDFTRTRPYRSNKAWEAVEKSRQQGPSVVQAFHELALSKLHRTRPILHDIVAFANGEGGAIYVGAHPDTHLAIHGLDRADDDMRILKEDVKRTIEPPLDVTFNVEKNGERGVIIIDVPEGDDKPYAYTPTGQIYLRKEGETLVATRDEIVSLVLGGEAKVERPVPIRREQPQPAAVLAEAVPQTQPATQRRPMRGERVHLPQQQPERVAAQEKPAAQEQRAQQPVPSPERVARTPFPNLPPEKIKGQLQPMVRKDDPIVESAAPPEVAALSAAGLQTPEVTSEAQPEQTAATPEIETAGRARGRGGRRSTGRGKVESAAITEQSTQEAPVPEAAASATLEIAEKSEVEKPARGRSRRKTGAQTAEAALEAAGPTAEPMETTVSAEHVSREENVAEREPKRGRRRTSTKELELEAPAAAAAASGSGAEAILVEAQLEPGPQIPGELTPEEKEPELTAPPATRGRSRRKSAAQKAAEAALAEAEADTAKKREVTTASTPAASAPQAETAAPGKGGRQGRAKSPGKTTDAAPQGEPPAPPTTGVEIVSTEARDGGSYHTMRDLRNESTVHNVTKQSARRLWHYAIVQHEHGDPAMSEIFWHPGLPIGLWRREQRAGAARCDLVSRYPDGSMRIFYGVTNDGLSGPWQDLLQMVEQAGYTGPSAPEK